MARNRPAGSVGSKPGALGLLQPPGDAAAVQAGAALRSGPPPAYVAGAEFDPPRDENIEYAPRLLRAGVSAELHQRPGTFHGSQAILSAEVRPRQTAELAAALRRAMAG
ncbi:alpha/beta hydrolase [Kitasatospora sp. NPDC001574]